MYYRDFTYSDTEVPVGTIEINQIPRYLLVL